MNKLQLLIIIPSSYFFFVLYPANSNALDLYGWTKAIDATNLIKPTSSDQFKDNYELLFVYSSQCGYCHKFAPILTEFADENNITIKAITADGGLLRGFEDAKFIPDITDLYNIKTFPTVLATKKDSKTIYLLSQGFLNKNELYANYSALISHISYEAI